LVRAFPGGAGCVRNVIALACGEKRHMVVKQATTRPDFLGAAKGKELSDKQRRRFRPAITTNTSYVQCICQAGIALQ